jgi:hypothetical protein
MWSLLVLHPAGQPTPMMSDQRYFHSRISLLPKLLPDSNMGTQTAVTPVHEMSSVAGSAGEATTKGNSEQLMAYSVVLLPHSVRIFFEILCPSTLQRSKLVKVSTAA